MLVLEAAVEQRLGLVELIASLPCHSPQGRQLARERRFYAPEARVALAEEFAALAELQELLGTEPQTVSSALNLLSRLRDSKGSIDRLALAQPISSSEWFEIKRCLQLIADLSQLSSLLQAAGVKLSPLDALAELLNPSGKQSQGFYLYDDYSPQLAELRRALRALERRLAQSSAAERQDLLWERSQLCKQEKDEEEQVLRALAQQASDYIPELKQQLAQIALLDWRLAKATLAKSWQACRPTLLPAEQPASLEDCRHPFLEAELSLQQQEFQAHKLNLAPGSTILSGANMGGKSLALQSVFFNLLLVQLGYCPACTALSTPLYDFFSFQEEQLGQSRQGLSSFGREAIALRGLVQLSHEGRGLIVLDEPFRGTNPTEATAMLQGLCRYYGRQQSRQSTLLLATHYRLQAGPGLHFYRLRGVDNAALQEFYHLSLARRSNPSGAKHEDQEALRRLQAIMDYNIEKLERPDAVPQAAIFVAAALGLDEELVQIMKEEWQEESWQD